MMVAGQRQRLVVCVVSDLAPGSGHAVWISGGNGSTLQSFTYGTSQEDGGTVCTVSLLPDDPPGRGGSRLPCWSQHNLPGPQLQPHPCHGYGPAATLSTHLACSPLSHRSPGTGASREQVRGPPSPADIAADVGACRKGFAAGPAAHLAPGRRCRLPSCSLIPQATKKRQSRARLVSLQVVPWRECQ